VNDADREIETVFMRAGKREEVRTSASPMDGSAATMLVYVSVFCLCMWVWVYVSVCVCVSVCGCMWLCA
jgi:hypothetical protein